MKKVLLIIIGFVMISAGCKSENASVNKKNETFDNNEMDSRFSMDKDLLLIHLDCKTDVDDVHTAAAFATLIANPAYEKLKFHVVAGAYGVQEGLYVPANELFELAFPTNWSDAHTDFNKAVKEVQSKVIQVIRNGGQVWIADGGQSDFSAAMIQSVMDILPDINPKEIFYIVQHSNWNEEVTSKEALAFVKTTIDYHKIPDGNAVGNGTPGFRSPDFKNVQDYIKDEQLKQIWGMALEIGNQYNAKEGRYNNEAVANGGVDFSDLSETCYILGLEKIKDSQEFFERFAR